MGLDIFIVIVYLAILVAMGFLGGKSVENAGDFTASGKRYGAPVIFASLAASYIGGGYSSGNAAEAFSSGLGMTIALFGFSIATIFTGKYLVPGISRFEGAASTGEIIARSYGKTAGVVTGFFAFFCCAGVVGAQMEAMGVVFHSLLSIPPAAGILLGCGIVLLYSTAGGLQSVIAADMVQFILLAVGMPLLLILSLHRAGGIGAVIQATPSSFFDPLNGTTLPGFLSLALTMTFGEMLVPPYTQRLLIGKNHRSTAKGTVASGLFSIPFFIITGLIGLTARALQVTEQPAEAMPQLILQVLPTGIRGVVMAAMVSIMLSAADGFLNGAAVSLVRDVVRPLCPTLSDKKELRYLRATNFLTGLTAVLVALFIPNIFRILILAYSCWSPVIVIPLAAALLGVKSDRRAFFKALVAGLITTLVWDHLLKQPATVTGTTVGIFANFLVFWWQTRRYRRHASQTLQLHCQ